MIPYTSYCPSPVDDCKCQCHIDSIRGLCADCECNWKKAFCRNVEGKLSTRNVAETDCNTSPLIAQIQRLSLRLNELENNYVAARHVIEAWQEACSSDLHMLNDKVKEIEKVMYYMSKCVSSVQSFCAEPSNPMDGVLNYDHKTPNCS